MVDRLNKNGIYFLDYRKLKSDQLMADDRHPGNKFYKILVQDLQKIKVLGGG